MRVLLDTVACLLVALALLSLPAPPASAEPGPETLRVATHMLPPMVLQSEGELSGFSIDLWNAIAERLKLKTEFKVADDIGSLLDLVRSNQADLGIAAVSITSEREESFDISQPILNAGLQILVRGAEETASNPLQDLLRILFSKAALVWLGVVLVLILVPAHLVWLFERRQPHGIVPERRYFPGIFYALFWAAGTLATQADQMPRQWMARVIAVLWMFSGVIFVAFYTAQLTATLTVQQIRGAINGPDDLPGRRVATLSGSTAAAYLIEHRAQVVEFTVLDAPFQSLFAQEVDAVVLDAPALHYFATHQGRGRVHVVGPTFHKEDYGIVFQPNSPLRRKVNAALLSLREDGEYQRIYEKWFGGGG